MRRINVRSKELNLVTFARAGKDHVSDLLLRVTRSARTASLLLCTGQAKREIQMSE